ncbi:unnamed protein product, partial [Prorocentrum cordatum]
KLPRSGPRGPGAASLAMAALTVEYIKNQTGEFDEQSVFQAILSHRSIPRIADGASRCCNLRWLDLSHNAIIRIENLDGLAQLVCLDLSFNKVSKVENLQGMQSLERLWLKSNPVSRLSDLDGLESARQLRHLSLQNIDASDFCPVCPPWQPPSFPSSRSSFLPLHARSKRSMARLNFNPEADVSTADDICKQYLVDSPKRLHDTQQAHDDQFDHTSQECTV